MLLGSVSFLGGKERTVQIHRAEEKEHKNYKTCVGKLIYLSGERSDICSSVRILCQHPKEPKRFHYRSLIKVVKYLKGTLNYCTRFPVKGEVKQIDIFADTDWVSDMITRKAVMGGVIMAGGCKLFSCSRGQDTIATSACNAEVLAASDIMKEGILLQYVLEFVGFGFLIIQFHMDSSSGRSFLHRKGPGTMEHIDVKDYGFRKFQAKVFS